VDGVFDVTEPFPGGDEWRDELMTWLDDVIKDFYDEGLEDLKEALDTAKKPKRKSTKRKK
jgi:hypothetical protein